jgi:hypothetical protein
MPYAVGLMEKPVGKPDAGDPHVRFNVEGWETELHATSPFLDATFNRIKFNPTYPRFRHSE